MRFLNSYAGRFPDAVATGLLCAAGLALAAGGVFPVAAKLGNPYWAYAIVFVSFPAWALGAVAAGAVAFRAGRREPVGRPVMLWGLALCAGNVLAGLTVLLVPFHAS